MYRSKSKVLGYMVGLYTGTCADMYEGGNHIFIHDGYKLL